MSPRTPDAPDPTRVEVTLLELVTALGELLDSPEEVARHARELIASGAVRLRGNFRDTPRALLGRELRRH